METWKKPEDTNGNFWVAVAAASCFKLLFLNSYRSTDFEVHRNWLAITYSVPLKDWYYENTSNWTLDYPPFFAYFEWTLAHIAKYFDPEMLDVANLNYASERTILFQKLSVIVTDLVLAIGVMRCYEAIRQVLPVEHQGHISRMKFFGLIFLNGGLFMVDHIHFQYNGFLFGVLLLSISKVIEGKLFQGSILFSILLNLKHIFLYMSPAYGVFLFAKYCVNPNSFSIRFGNLLKLGAIVVTVFTSSFAPFYQQLPQVFSRLFPFRRGLCHAYWAPNIWAAYSSLDLILNFSMQRGKSSLTGGIVGENQFAVLPSVQPIHSLILTVLLNLPAMHKIWKHPTELNFIYGIVTSSWTAYMFGYHVHEKAILNILIPLALISSLEPKIFLICLAAGSFSLFPLLFTPFEIIFKALLFTFHLSLSFSLLNSVKFNYFEILYLLGFLPLFFVENLLPLILIKFPFLPLICVSDYCFLGIMYTYIKFYLNFVNSSVSNTPTLSSQMKSKCSNNVKTLSKGKNKQKVG